MQLDGPYLHPSSHGGGHCVPEQSREEEGVGQVPCGEQRDSNDCSTSLCIIFPSKVNLSPNTVLQDFQKDFIFVLKLMTKFNCS